MKDFAAGMKSRIDLGPVQLSLLLLLISRPGGSGSGSGSHTTLRCMQRAQWQLQVENSSSTNNNNNNKSKKSRGKHTHATIKMEKQHRSLANIRVSCLPPLPHEIAVCSALCPALSVSYGNFHDYYYYWVREKLHLSIVRRAACAARRAKLKAPGGGKK